MRKIQTHRERHVAQQEIVDFTGKIIDSYTPRIHKAVGGYLKSDFIFHFTVKLLQAYDVIKAKKVILEQDKFIYGIYRNLLSDFYKKIEPVKKRLRLIESYDGFEDSISGDARKDIFGMMNSADIQKLALSLTKMQLKTFYDVFVNDLDRKKLADEEGISLDTLNHRVADVKKIMKKLVNESNK